MPYCQNCGEEIGDIVNFCAVCGAPKVATPAEIVKVTGKSKVASILLAVFLGFWTWLYTYKKEKWKFWVALSVFFIPLVVTYCILFIYIADTFPEAAETWTFPSLLIPLFILIYFIHLIGFGIWIWAIVDTSIKKQEWYRNY